MILTHHDLKQDFHSWLEAWHQGEGYESEFKVLAERLGVCVKKGNRSKYDPATATIYIARNLHAFRERHEGLHEVTHHLFHTAEDGRFLEAARRLGAQKLKSQKEVEESIVEEASWQLLTPTHQVDAICRASEFDVEAMVKIARACRTSFEFAAQRVGSTLSRPCRGLVMDSRGWVTASFGNGIGDAKYTSGKEFFVEETHLLRQISRVDQVVEFNAKVPFKRSRQSWRVPVEAWKDSSRHQTLALFGTRRNSITGMQPLLEVTK